MECGREGVSLEKSLIRVMLGPVVSPLGKRKPGRNQAQSRLPEGSRLGERGQEFLSSGLRGHLLGGNM